MKFTGERFTPSEKGRIRLEHYHRYAAVLELAKGKRVLDVACGEGFGASLVADIAHSVIGVDISEEAIQHALVTYAKPNLAFHLGDATSLNFPDGSFDVVVSFETLEHISEQEQMIAQIRRVLTSDGVLVISTPNRPVYSEKSGELNPFHVKELDFQELDFLLKSRFDNVRYFGQRLQISSIIQELDTQPNTCSLWSDTGTDLELHAPSLKDPLYFVAVCRHSSTTSSEVVTSLLYPQSLDLLEHYVNFAKWAKAQDDVVAGCNWQIEQLKQIVLEGEQAIFEREQTISAQKQEISAQQKTISAQEQMISEHEEKILELLSNWSWRSAKPLRQLTSWIAGLVQSIKDALRKQDAKANLLTLRSWEKSSRAIEALSRSPEKISLPLFNHPVVSVIIPIYGKVEYTLRCLASIALNPPAVPFEIIVVDDLSPDDSLEMLDKIKGVRLLRNEQNQGFLRSCNYGASEARGQYLHFLNNDTEVEAGWLDELLLTLQKEPNAGLVGSKLIYPDGYLQEAGGIIWRDGSAWNWGHRQDPAHSAYNYVRDVDYISGASIMVPAEVFQRLGMFNTLYAPAYYEDTDLAMAVRQAGLRVIYQPYSRVIHFEGVSSGTDITQGTKQFQEINRVKFIDRWASELSGLTPNAFKPFLSCDRRKTRHILIVDACTPTPDQDSGSLDMINLIKILIEQNWRVHFVPLSNFLHFGPYTDTLQRLGVECVYAPHHNTLDSFLSERGDMFDVCLLARTDVTNQALPTVKKFCPSAKTIFYTVDLHFLRERREAELQNDSEKLRKAIRTERTETGLMDKVDSTVVLSEVEHKILRDLGKTNVTVIPLIRDIGNAVSTKVSQRHGVLFVGGFSHLPNVDAVEFLVESIWPEVRKILIARSLSPVPLYIVGSQMPKAFEAFSCADIIPIGFVKNLSEVFEKVRISVAPLRYGAGLKGKVASSFFFGIPVIGTAIAYEGMPSLGLDDIRYEADTPVELATLIVDLHSSEKLLEIVGKSCREYATQHYATQSVSRTVASLLHTLTESTRDRH